MRFLNDAHTIKVPFVSLCGWLAWWGVRVLPKPRNVSVNSWANLVCRWFRSIQADRSMRYNLFHLQHTLDIRMAVYSTFKATNLCNTIIIIISLIRTNVTENRFFFFILTSTSSFAWHLFIHLFRCFSVLFSRAACVTVAFHIRNKFSFVNARFGKFFAFTYFPCVLVGVVIHWIKLHIRVEFWFVFDSGMELMRSVN